MKWGRSPGAQRFFAWFYVAIGIVVGPINMLAWFAIGYDPLEMRGAWLFVALGFWALIGGVQELRKLPKRDPL